MYDVASNSTLMRSSILCLSWLSLFGSAFGGIKLPVKGGKLPVFAPRVLQWDKQGPPKGGYPQPPPNYNTQYWTVSPYPTTAGSVPPSSPPGTSYPTYIVSAEATSPTKAPTVSAYDEACAAAAQGAVFSTSHAVTLNYFYELLTETFFNVSDVSSHVDKSIQSALAPTLVGCSRRRRRMAQGNITILGVSQESEDTVTSTACSSLKASSDLDEVCFTVQSALTVYLEKSNADASLSIKVFAALSDLLSGTSLVNQQVGIYGLAFVGASLPTQKAADTTASSTNAVQTGTTASTDSSGLTLTPGSVVVIAAVCLTVLVVAFLVMRRGRQWPAAHKAGIMKMPMDDDEKDGDLKLDDERLTPKTMPNASFDKDVGMFVEYEDDESNGYGKVVATRPILRDMDKDAPSPPPSKKTRGSWFAARSRSPQFGSEGESVELELPPGSPAKSPRRKYSVENTVNF